MPKTGVATPKKKIAKTIKNKKVDPDRRPGKVGIKSFFIKMSGVPHKKIEDRDDLCYTCGQPIVNEPYVTINYRLPDGSAEETLNAHASTECTVPMFMDQVSTILYIESLPDEVIKRRLEEAEKEKDKEKRTRGRKR